MIPERLQPILEQVRPLAERFDAEGHRLYLVGGIIYSLAQHRFLALPFMALFATGFLTMAVGSLRKAFVMRLGAAPAEALTAPAHATRIPERRQAAAENHG